MPRRYSSPRYLFEIPWQVFDLAIFAMLAACAALHVYGQAHGNAFLRGAGLLGFLTLVYGSFVEPRRLTVRRYQVGTGERRLKVAFLSDLHAGPYKGAAWSRKLVARVNALSPDVILLGGDLLYKEAKDLPKLEPLKALRAPLGVYAILGNHDEHHASAESKAWCERSEIPLLLNRAVRKAKDGMSISIAGADDDWFGETDLAAAVAGLAPEGPAVIMLHNPDLVPPMTERLKGRKAPTLLLCGHTHGGQIRLPLVGPLMVLPHHIGRKYDRGRFDFEGFPLIIGAGTGESGPRARLFCPPEIVLAELRY